MLFVLTPIPQQFAFSAKRTARQTLFLGERIFSPLILTFIFPPFFFFLFFFNFLVSLYIGKLQHFAKVWLNRKSDFVIWKVLNDKCICIMNFISMMLTKFFRRKFGSSTVIPTSLLCNLIMISKNAQKKVVIRYPTFDQFFHSLRRGTKDFKIEVFFNTCSAFGKTSKVLQKDFKKLKSLKYLKELIIHIDF